MATINTSVSLAYNTTVGLLEKLVRLYIDSGKLNLRFSVFDAPEVRYGKGYEHATVLGAKKQNDGTGKAEEHGVFPAKVMDTFITDVTGGQYAVTLDPRRVNECVGDDTAAQQYAAELTESLYQGWYRDKNRAVADKAGELITKGKTLGAYMAIPLVEGGDDAFAATVIATIKGKVENIKEGQKGSAYGNTFIGDDEIAADDVVIVMSNDFAAFLDVHGFARAFSAEYLNTSRVKRVTSAKIPDGTVLITDARNIQARPKYEEFVPIMNSDGSRNFFYNKYEWISVAVATGGDYDGQIAYPYFLIEKTEG